jgi:hypothetical protein
MTLATSIPSDTGWFYNIIQAQTLVLGFGILSRQDPYDRLIEYSRPVHAPQQFCNLYYGKYSEIRNLERYVKNQWKDKLSDLFSDEKLEWFDPDAKVELKDLEHFVETAIVEYPYETIKKVKSKFIPFTLDNQGLFKNIEINPDYFLDEVKLDKKRKIVV